jgi:UDP-galactopyranose mutase
MKSHKKNSAELKLDDNRVQELYPVKEAITIKIVPEVSAPGNKIKNVICFAHLRWDFVFQRPQHLLSRCAKESNVYYFEEPIFSNTENHLQTKKSKENVTVITPHIREGLTEQQVYKFLEEALGKYIRANAITDYLFWYLTPMAIPFTQRLNPLLVVYDCMDELSCFKGAHPDILKHETSLIGIADVVFTGGHHLYEYKKKRHSNIHPFPSSIDQKHFEGGIGSPDPDDQAAIPHPRVGFFGVIDERMDIELLGSLAISMPNVHFVMIGPVVKIKHEALPKSDNIHYLGQKNYQELPQYLANWDVAFLPFAKNDSTRFISPTKTPEYLCAGKPVVSTSIRDVVMPYGEEGLVHIADSVQDFSRAIGKALGQKNDNRWKNKVKNMLKTNSWDLTWANMKKKIMTTLENKQKMRKEFTPVHNGLLKVNNQTRPINTRM